MYVLAAISIHANPSQPPIALHNNLSHLAH